MENVHNLPSNIDVVRSYVNARSLIEMLGMELSNLGDHLAALGYPITSDRWPAVALIADDQDMQQVVDNWHEAEAS
jgi:hypothetical protein